MEPDNLQIVKKILQEATDILCENLDPGDVLRKLKTKGVLKPADVTRIKKETTTEEKVEKLLDILSKKPVSAYDVFMDILKEERDDLHRQVKRIEAKHNYKHGGKTELQSTPHSPSQAAGGKTELESTPHRPKSQAAGSSSQSGQHAAAQMQPQAQEFDMVEPDAQGYYTQSIRSAPEPSLYQRNSDKCYTSLLTQGSKGFAYILNIHKFSRQSQLPERLGSLEDFANMKHLFRQLGYVIVEYSELERQEIFDTIDTFVAMINSAPDTASSVVVLMSHGDDGILFGKDGKGVELRTIEDKFKPSNCSALKGKPKLFFIQACRGGVGETLVHADSNKIVDDERKVDPSVDDVTNNADIFTAFATTEGFFSLRNKIKGSWFVQVIVEVFVNGAHEESLHQLMNQVTNRVSALKGMLYDQETNTLKRVRQTPQIKHTLRKDVFFHPKL